MEAIVIPSDSDGRFPLADHASAGDSQLVHESLFSLFFTAYLNVNTNATTRGDAQVSRHSQHLWFMM